MRVRGAGVLTRRVRRGGRHGVRVPTELWARRGRRRVEGCEVVRASPRGRDDVGGREDRDDPQGALERYPVRGRGSQ